MDEERLELLEQILAEQARAVQPAKTQSRQQSFECHFNVDFYAK